MCIVIICFPVCDVINFLFTEPTTWDKNLNILRMKKAFNISKKHFSSFLKAFHWTRQPWHLSLNFYRSTNGFYLITWWNNFLGCSHRKKFIWYAILKYFYLFCCASLYTKKNRPQSFCAVYGRIYILRNATFNNYSNSLEIGLKPCTTASGVFKTLPNINDRALLQK